MKSNRKQLWVSPWEKQVITTNFRQFVSTTFVWDSASQVALVVKSLPANEGDIRELGLIPESGRSPGGGHGNYFQYSCLENPMDRGAWRATVHRVAKSWTQLKRFGTHRWTKGVYNHFLSCWRSGLMGSDRCSNLGFLTPNWQLLPRLYSHLSSKAKRKLINTKDWIKHWAKQFF